MEGVRKLGLHTVGRLRKDKVLRFPYTGPHERRPGRKRQFDGGFDRRDPGRMARTTLKKEKVDLYHAPLHSKAWQRWLQVVYILPRGADPQTKEGMLLYSTDLELPGVVPHSGAAGLRGGSRHPVAGMAVNCSRRWHPLFHEAHKMMKAGDLGEMLQVTGYGTCPLSSNGSHLIDTMCFLADSKVDWLFGELNETDAATPDADLQGNAYLAFANGLRGYMRGMNCGAASWDFEAIGTEGRIRSSTHGLDFELHRLVPGGIRGASLPVKYPYPWPVSIEGMGEIIISDLIHCIETGDSPRCSGDDARHALEVAFGVHASHRAGGRRIDLPLDERNQRILHAEVRAAIEEADRGAFTPEVQDHGETVERNGAPARSWAAPASANGWPTPPTGPACAA